MAQILADAGLGAWRRQVDLGGERWCGRVDLLAEDLPLVVEVNSEAHHSALTDVAADAERRVRLEAAGFTVVEVWDVEVWHAPGVVVERVRSARRTVRAPARRPEPHRRPVYLVEVSGVPTPGIDTSSRGGGRVQAAGATRSAGTSCSVRRRSKRAGSPATKRRQRSTPSV